MTFTNIKELKQEKYLTKLAFLFIKYQIIIRQIFFNSRDTILRHWQHINQIFRSYMKQAGVLISQFAISRSAIIPIDTVYFGTSYKTGKGSKGKNPGSEPEILLNYQSILACHYRQQLNIIHQNIEYWKF
ncbi:Hypothetical_protein [Hexamita inflata]|uniref:Hypothetical_protein n=1 Tax=Hexamita inflata TaxID=28002 RepID=A0AA86R5N8_9EUKA|nr:Hypothetical protein HINF_LOCUS54067 [Hexamita inflata]